MLVLLLFGTAAGAHAQDGASARAEETARDSGGNERAARQQTDDTRSAERDARRAALDVRIDSLLVEQRRLSRLIAERAASAPEHSPVAGTDTVNVGPFLFVNRSRPPAAAVAALENAWRIHEPMVGAAADRLSGTVVSLNLSERDFEALPDPARLYHLASPLGSRASFAGAASHTVLTALVDLLPDTMQQWVEGGGLFRDDVMAWAYRDLATTSSLPGRACFAGDMQACALALTGEAWRDTHPTMRTSLLQHALALGEAGAYERLLSDAPDIPTRLANAAGRPFDSVIASWRDELDNARPRVHAGVARAGLWTVVWLMGLGLLAMRSTRWRLG